MAHSMDLRKRIVSAAKSGKSYSEVARQFSVDRGTVREYVRRAEAGELAAKKPPGRERKLNAEQVEALREQVLSYPDKTLQEHAELLEKEQGVKLAFSAVNTYFKRMGISFKKNAIRQEA